MTKLPKGYLKKYKGDMKAAWAAFKTKGKSSPDTKKRKGSRGMAKKKGGKRKGGGGRKLIGNMGLKGLLVSAGLLFGAKYLVRRYLPQAGAYTTAASGLAAGALGGALGVGKQVMAFGAIDGLSELFTDLVSVGGLITLPGINGGAKVSGAYEIA